MLAEMVPEEMQVAGEILRHIVLFGFKDGTGPADVGKIVDAFVALQHTIPEIKAFEWGTNVSPENKNNGLTHAFIATFHSAADRDAYLPHPDHVAFTQLVGPFVENVTVVDYWSPS